MGTHTHIHTTHNTQHTTHTTHRSLAISTGTGTHAEPCSSHSPALTYTNTTATTAAGVTCRSRCVSPMRVVGIVWGRSGSGIARRVQLVVRVVFRSVTGWSRCHQPCDPPAADWQLHDDGGTCKG